MPAHRRQFILGPQPRQVRPDWSTLELRDGVHVSHCPMLPVLARGNRVLLGVAVQTDPTGPSPAEELDRRDELERGAATWAGRWLAVDGDTLRLDAAGTLGCYYRTIDGALWASSSPELLRALQPSLPRPAAHLAHARGMDWYPPPSSGIDGIRRLLPSQTLRFDGVLGARPVLPPAPGDREYAVTIASMAERLTVALSALAERYERLWLPLSGGRDSRLLLAAAAAADVSVTPYTFDKPGISRADRELPPKLARAVGFEHVFVPAGPVDPVRLALFDEHTALQIPDMDRHFFACGQWDRVPDGVLDLGGGLFETGRCYYWRKLPELPGSVEETAAAICAALPTGRPDGVRAWAEWLHATSDPDLDWRDRFYIEQRGGGWLSAIGQALDLTGATRVHVASCGAYLAETLSLPVHVRRIGAHHDHLIERLAPPLARFPVNPPDSLRLRLTARIRREAKLYGTHGGPRTYVAGRLRQLAERRAARRLS